MKRGLIIACLALILVLTSITNSWARSLLAPQAQELGQITSPRDSSSVRGLVPIDGSAAHGQFQKYELHYSPEPGDQWTPIQGSPFTVPVVQGRLALWDTTIIPDGIYSLRLRLVRLDGNYDEYFVRGIQVVNTSPTETPTPAATPTPSAPTETPAPTATIVLAVPTVSSPTPRPSSTPLPTAFPTETPEPVDLPFGVQGAGDAACKGAGATLALFLGIGLFFALKGWFVSVARWLARRGREGFGVYKD